MNEREPGRVAVPSGANHHGSHRGLLGAARVTASTGGWVDLVAVPSHRPVGYLREAVRLTKQLGCLLLVVASGRCSAREVVNRYGAQLPGRLLAVDIHSDGVPTHEWLRLETDRLAAVVTPRKSDVSLKRNYALLFARALGARRLLFLDDDMIVPVWSDILRASGAMSDEFQAVGLDIKGFPDNSVVCHAHRVTGGVQDTFVGGGALLLDPQEATGFFPNMYSEDWFFLLDRAAHRSVGLVGMAAQRPYDPFFTPDRAEGEEFGDLLAEGLYWLLDEGRSVRDADEAYWREALYRRSNFIAEIIDRRDEAQLPPDGRRRMEIALRAAERVHNTIEPSACVEYVRAWDRDRELWAERLGTVRTGQSLRDALAQLGLRRFEATAELDGGIPAEGRNESRAGPQPRADHRGRLLWLPPTPILLAAVQQPDPLE